jgi:hypothetical protein
MAARPSGLNDTKNSMARVTWHGSGMRKDGRLGPRDWERLKAVLADRNSPQKHVWRSRIILATAEGCGNDGGDARRADVSKPTFPG